MKYVALLVIFAAFCSALATKSCPTTVGWHHVGHKCYYLKYQYARYLVNKDLCKQLNATMVSIHSKDENDALTTLIGDNAFWLGLERPQVGQMNFVWQDGTPVDFTYWESGPNVWTAPFGAYIKIQFWRTESANNQNNQMCQIDLGSDPVNDENVQQRIPQLAELTKELITLQKELLGKVTEIAKSQSKIADSVSKIEAKVNNN